ncbi:MAG: amidohydrolase family protein [Firmicutes bacterium]|jgi:N-acyl-D-amino-acid deacylase|nr:amidohydrolase family protein [Bacillota bacterium]
MDVVIKNGLVFDPRWEKPQRLNVGLKGEKIAVITEKDLTGETVIDAGGKVVSPGFINIHSHSDKNFKGKGYYFETAESELKMGVTTLVGGNCGISPIDFKEYRDYINENGAPNNYLGFMGHTSLRAAAGKQDRYTPANAGEIAKMRDFLKRGMESGAIGLSFGLEYAPGTDMEEISGVCEALKEFPDALLSAHYRYDADRASEGVEEMIEISKTTGIPMQISHLNSGICFGRANDSLEVFHRARANGIDVMADCYPYNAFSTYIGSAVFDPGCLEKWNAGYEDLQVAEGEFAGQRCTEELFNRLRSENPDIYLNAFVMKEEEVVKVLKDPFTMIASDGLLRGGQGHPRVSGTFPRVLGRYCRELKALTLKEALYKMTTMPAERLRLSGRGVLEEGAFGDIVIFDYSVIIDKADFTRPALSPEGIEYVLVNGRPAVFDGKVVNKKLGRAL